MGLESINKGRKKNCDCSKMEKIIKINKIDYGLLLWLIIFFFCI